MTDLGRLGYAEIHRMFSLYENIFYHRTVILERIREIAFRNIIHVIEARQYCRKKDEKEPSIESVHAKMLSDQGLENNKTNQTIIDWATFLPVRLYLAVFYAEIEFYKKCKKKDKFFIDSELDAYLKSNKHLMDKLRRFRHSFLHPSDTSTSAELDFLQDEISYNIAPILQGKIDGYLLRLRARLSNYLCDIINDLPENQKLYCLCKFFEVNEMRMKLHHDASGASRCKYKTQELLLRKKALPTNLQTWAPNEQQEQAARCIAKCLNDVNPAWPEIEIIQIGYYAARDLDKITPTTSKSEAHFLQPVERQTPMRDHLLYMLAAGEKVPDFLGSGRHTQFARANKGLYTGLLLTGIVLLNEFLYEESPIPISIMQYIQQNSPTEEELTHFFQGLPNHFGLQKSNEWIAPQRVIMALFYELVRVYQKVSEEDPSVTHPKLEAIISPNTLKKLRLHRNSVFHVFDSGETPNEVDLMFTASGNLDIIEDIITGVMEFWGVRYSFSKNADT